ncbi:hypothetical protein MMC11_001240 [Xylographa trunciseda]|nr:hypothetical protein [Xylographa trunciseda]
MASSQRERGLDNVYVYLVEGGGKKQWVLETEVVKFVEPKAASRSGTLKSKPGYTIKGITRMTPNQFEALKLSSRVNKGGKSQDNDSLNDTKGDTAVAPRQVTQPPFISGSISQKFGVHDNYHASSESNTPRDAVLSGIEAREDISEQQANLAPTSREVVLRQPGDASSSRPAETSEKISSRDIYIYPPSEEVAFSTPTSKMGDPYLVVASLDTQCNVGNLISQELVHRLGMDEYIKSHTRRAKDFNGRELEFAGDISFRWKLRKGTSIHESAPFLVVKMEIDIILGIEDIVSKDLLVEPWPSVLSLTEHKPLDLRKS